LLAVAATGCRHKQPVPLASSQAPSIKTTKTPPPPSGNPLSTQSQPPLPNLPAAPEDASQHAPKPPLKTHRRRKLRTDAATAPATAEGAAPGTGTGAGTGAAPGTAGAPASTPPAAAGAATTPQAPETTPAAVAPPSIGELSAGDVSKDAQTRRDTVDLIVSTETGLAGIKSFQNGQDKQTAGEIRSFLQKAKSALEADDIDGAHTLATKARVLLDELTKR